MAKIGSTLWKKTQANKKRIYASAMRLFSAHGYDQVSVDDIAREAQSSKGTFYNYFKSKDELFVFYNQSLDERFLAFYNKLLTNRHHTGKDALDKLYIMIMFTLHVLGEGGREFTTVSDIRQLREESGDALQEDVLCNSVLNFFPALLEMGRRDGSIDPHVDSDQLELLIYFYLKGIVFQWESQQRDQNLLELARPAILMLCNSIAASPKP